MGTWDWHSSMKREARSRSRLATATSLELPALRIAFQFLRAMFAVPRMPQRQMAVIYNPFPGRGEPRTKARGVKAADFRPRLASHFQRIHWPGATAIRQLCENVRVNCLSVDVVDRAGNSFEPGTEMCG